MVMMLEVAAMMVEVVTMTVVVEAMTVHSNELHSNEDIH